MWTPFLTLILFLIPFVYWLFTRFQVTLFGYHLHHFWISFFYFGIFILSMVMHPAKHILETRDLHFTVMHRNDTRTYSFTVIYRLLPVLALVLGVICFVTDYADFITFLKSV